MSRPRHGRRGPVGLLARGVVAGVVGTAAMTASSTIEAKLRGRPASTAPARAAQKVLGIEEFSSERNQERFSNAVHWGYGTGWGVARAVFGAVGMAPVLASAAHLTAMWGGALAMLPALGVTPPATQWGREEVAIDLFHHLVYESSTSLAYELLDHR
ncbi:DUF1440 domain-containing protein [Nocardioides sp. WL0053]|uniref:DUF1440 domain-containing protein n=1 Tax=Nocardioides jiangsuensis TaxID=2866161 RepID=A0ABS7RSH2_9ACTN|nr:DUF1440 domain-containing protein [Nocardioides jiangsuensis]MBY9076567.1 DUF1440 domain-containing protein [Nocardioides jiangsuensis]